MQKKEPAKNDNKSNDDNKKSSESKTCPKEQKEDQNVDFLKQGSLLELVL